MKLKKKILSMFSLVMSASVFAPLLTSCFQQNQQSTNSGGGVIDSTESEPENGLGTLDEKVSSKISLLENIEFTPIVSNIFGLEMYKSDYLDQIKDINYFDNSEYPNANADNIDLDIYNFVNQIYLSSNSKVDLTITNNQISFNKDTQMIEINLEIKVSNNYKITRSVIVNNKEYFISPKSERTINIIVPSQKINYKLSYDSISKKHYLQWTVNNVSISIDNSDAIKYDDFSFSKTNSYAIPYYVNNIFVENQEYLNETKFDLSKLTSDKVKSDIDSHFKNTKDVVINYVGFAADILEVINKNLPLNDTVEQLASIVANILVKSGIVDQSLTGLIVDVLESKKGLLTILDEHRDDLLNFIAPLVESSGLPIDAIESILKDIKPGMKESQKQLFINLIKSDFIPVAYQDLLVEIAKTIFDDKTTFDLIDYIFNNLLDSVNGLLPQSELITSAINVAKLILTKNENGQYGNILDLILDNKTIIGGFLTSLLSLLNMSGYNELIDQVYTNNSNLTLSTLQNLLSTTIIPLAKFLKDTNNYQIVSQYVKENNVDSFSYNQNTNQVSYKYELKFIFKNDFKLELKPIYNILPDNLSMGGTSIPINLILGVNVLPDYFTFKTNDSLDMNFSADNNYLYLTPIQKSNHYVFNYTIPYSVDFKLNMPNGFDDLYRQYNEKVIGIPAIPWGFIKSFGESFLMPTYTMAGSLSATDETWVNYNYIYPLPELDVNFKWNDLTSDQLKSLSNYISVENSNSYLVHSKDQQNIGSIFKPNYVDKEFTLTGKKAVLINDKKEELQNLLFSFGEGVKNLPDNLKPVISINPTINGAISVAGALNINIDVKIIEVKVFFPTIRTIDMNNSNVDNKEFVYSNSYSKTFSF